MVCRLQSFYGRAALWSVHPVVLSRHKINVFDGAILCITSSPYCNLEVLGALRVPLRKTFHGKFCKSAMETYLYNTASHILSVN